MKLTTCGNCGTVYEDTNTSNDNLDYNDAIRNDVSELPTIKLEDGNAGYGCNNCLTDGYLQDNLNATCGGQALALYNRYHECLFK